MNADDSVIYADDVAKRCRLAFYGQAVLSTSRQGLVNARRQSAAGLVPGVGSERSAQDDGLSGVQLGQAGLTRLTRHLFRYDTS